MRITPADDNRREIRNASLIHHKEQISVNTEYAKCSVH